MRSTAIISAIATLLLLFPGCGEQQTPQTPVDGPRLAVLSPAMTVILRDLGELEHVVGRHGFDLILQDAVPAVGNETGLDYEALLDVQPTHVVLQQNAREPPQRLQDLAAAQGWEVVTIPLLQLDDIPRATLRLSALVGGDEQSARALVEEMSRAFRVRPALQARLGRTLALASTDPIGALGPGSFHWEMLASMGATPIPEEGSPYIRLGLEDVLELDPDALVIFAPGSDQEVLGALAHLDLRAEQRVLVIRDPLAHTPSTALIAIADQIAETAAGWSAIDTPGESGQ
ncbi:MAG: ABC transporter substrate-binding protein [Planctomycetota bacterium]